MLFNSNSIQIQFKFNSNSIQIQFKSNSVQIQFEFETNLIHFRFKFHSIAMHNLKLSQKKIGNYFCNILKYVFLSRRILKEQ